MKYILYVALIIMLGSCKQKVNVDALSKGYELPTTLAAIGDLLDSIHVEDQKYRAEIEEIKGQFGWESKEMMLHWDKINHVDAGNLKVVEQILEKHGWLGADDIGGRANSALFLVIQHADQITQEKYLPMMREAVVAGKADAGSLALLEDRVGLGKGELQLYGSQIGTDQETGEMYVLPLYDPDNVNDRRAKVGLGTIEEYVGYWDIVWDVEEYKKKLPAWVELLKSQTRN